jgi:hypothetical protein
MAGQCPAIFFIITYRDRLEAAVPMRSTSTCSASPKRSMSCRVVMGAPGTVRRQGSGEMTLPGETM